MRLQIAQSYSLPLSSSLEQETVPGVLENAALTFCLPLAFYALIVRDSIHEHGLVGNR